MNSIFLDLSKAIAEYTGNESSVGHLGFSFVSNKELTGLGLNDNNMFNLLIHSDYSYSDTITTFKEIPKSEITSSDLKTRLQIKKDIIIYKADPEGDDLLEITSDEQDMLLELVKYRTNQPYSCPEDWTSLPTYLSKFIWTEMQDIFDNLESISNIAQEVTINLNSEDISSYRKLLYQILLIKLYTRGIYAFS